MNSYQENQFKVKLNSCLQQVRLILENDKSRDLDTPDNVAHKYEDKYALANQLSNSAIASLWNILFQFGLTQEQFTQVQQWSSKHSISIRFEINNTCKFLKEKTRNEESPKQTEISSTGIFAGKTTIKTITKITEYFYLYESNWQLVLFKGLGESAEDQVVLQSRKASLECIQLTKSFPKPEVTKNFIDQDITWLFQHFLPGSPVISFKINRNSSKCFTPVHNLEIGSLRYGFSQFLLWSDRVQSFLTSEIFDLQDKYSKQANRINLSELLDVSSLFIPLVSYFHNADKELPLTSNLLEDTLPTSDTLPVTSTPSTSLIQIAQDTESSSLMANNTDQTQVLISSSEIDLFLQKHVYLLEKKAATLRETLLPHKTTVFNEKEAYLATLLLHIIKLSERFHESIDFIELMIRKQLIAAIGKEISPEDFGNYMTFHYRKLFREKYQPKAFSWAVRCNANHSPEGIVKIELKNTNSLVPSYESIATFCHSTYAEEGTAQTMDFAINASTKIRFNGDRHVHGWIAHSFSGSALPSLQLVAQARQFSSYIVMIGRILSANSFDPKHAFIVQNKDELSIPLNLETIPTPKQFRDAIESLSPEQKRFAKAFRAMQLESTLFGVCIIQIKPQLEQVLKLPLDSLTKEIRLTQDLMKMFIEYQIPSDLLSFDAANESLGLTSENIDNQTKINAVKSHVKDMLEMIDQAKKEELEEKNREREFQYGRPPEIKEQSRYLDECDECEEYEESAPLAIKEISYPPKGGGPSFSFFSSSSHSSAKAKPVARELSRRSVSNNTEGAVRARKAELHFAVPSPPPAAPVCAAPGSIAPPQSPAPPTSTVSQTPQVENIQKPSEVEINANESTEETNVYLNDYSKLPSLLDERYEKYDSDNALRPTIINVGNEWKKISQKTLLGSPSSTTLFDEEQRKERSAAFDLLDALTRSGALVLEHASLHVIIGATHRFDQNIMDTIVQNNINPIERVERSSLIMASTLHEVSASVLVQDIHQERLRLTCGNLIES